MSRSMAFLAYWLAALVRPEDEEGQGLVEYALILALIAVVCFATLALFGAKIDNLYNQIQNSWPN